MSWKQWTAIVLVIGVGIVLQIPLHEGEMEEHPHPTAGETSSDSPPSDAAPGASEPVGPHRTIDLHVTGMT